MHYQGNIFRPPSEASSILLQATTGCSHNKCTFCEMYNGVRFDIKPDDLIEKDIDYAAKHMNHVKRLFICDGDALIIPQTRLVKMLTRIREKLPNVQRVGTYANTKGLGSKSAEELEKLKQLGLGIVYMGLESGDDLTLKAIHKGADSEKMIEMGRKCKQAGIKLSITVLLGIAGKERSLAHAKETGRVLSAIDPDYIGALSLMLTPGTPLYEDHQKDRFLLPDAREMLGELGTMIEHTHLTNGLFHANHASNYLPIMGTLPGDKHKMLGLINRALGGKVPLKPESMRGL